MVAAVRTALMGLGNVGRSFLSILETKAGILRRDYDVDFRIVCIADSSGVAVDMQGFDPAGVRQAKEGGANVRALDGYRSDMSPAQVLSGLDCDLVLEATPVNLTHGEPGLGIVRAALARGMAVVLANKGPLVLAFAELQRLARASHAQIAYSATVCGALPVVNVGQRDLVAAEIFSLRGIFNSTTNFILAEMAAGRPFDDALQEAQIQGIAEADPSLDVDGWDTANKLVIIANGILGVAATLANVQVSGIRHLTSRDLAAAQRQGQMIKLVATARATGDGYELSVGPAALSQHEFLANCHGWEMGVEIETDLYGKLYFKNWENSPLPTAGAMLRDALLLVR